MGVGCCPQGVIVLGGSGRGGCSLHYHAVEAPVAPVLWGWQGLASHSGVATWPLAHRVTALLSFGPDPLTGEAKSNLSERCCNLVRQVTLTQIRPPPIRGAGPNLSGTETNVLGARS